VTGLQSTSEGFYWICWTDVEANGPSVVIAELHICACNPKHHLREWTISGFDDVFFDKDVIVVSEQLTPPVRPT
jgi:hypothetical protein